MQDDISAFLKDRIKPRNPVAELLHQTACQIESGEKTLISISAYNETKNTDSEGGLLKLKTTGKQIITIELLDHGGENE